MQGPDVESFFDIERLDYVEEEGPQGRVVSEVERRPIVISLGGSLFYTEDEDGTSVLALDYLSDVAEWLKAISRSFKVFIVVGGGRAAKEIIVGLREHGVGESALDSLGIDMTRVNARVLRCIMGLPGLKVPEDFDMALAESAYSSVVVMGGTHPGHTTDAVAAMLADSIGATLLVIATDVDGIFNADPKEVPDARLFGELSPEDVCFLSADYAVGAGSKSPIDPMAARVIARSSIRTVILNGTDLENLEQAVRGGEFVGTVIETDVESTFDDEDLAGIAEAKRRELEKKTVGRPGREAKTESKRLLLKSFAKGDGKRGPKATGRAKPPVKGTDDRSKAKKEPGGPEGPTGDGPSEKGSEDSEPGGKEASDEGAEEVEPEGETTEEGPGTVSDEGGSEAGSEDGKDVPPDGEGDRGKEETQEEGDDDIDWDTEAEEEEETPDEGGDGPARKAEKGDDAEWDLPSLDDVEV